MKHNPMNARPVFLAVFRKALSSCIFVTVIVMNNKRSYGNPSISSRKMVYSHSSFHMISNYSPLGELYLGLQTAHREQKPP